MHQVLLNKFRKTLIILVLIVSTCTGCNKKIETITVGEWLLEISNKLNIKDYSRESPYFVNIDKSSIYYDSVQSLVEWGVIENNSKISVDEKLNKEFLAYTLTNLFSEDLNAVSIKDSYKSNYPKHVEKSVALGIMQLDSRGCFNPKEIIDKNEALIILDKISNIINQLTFEKSFYEYKWNEDLVLVKEKPLEYDKNNDIGYFNKDINLKKNDIVNFKDDDFEYIKKIEDIILQEDTLKATFIDPEIDELYSEINIQDSFEINFDNAIIEGISEDLNESNEYESNEDFNSFEIDFDNAEIIKLNNSNSYNKKFELNDFKIKISTKGNSIDVNINKISKLGSEIYASASLYSVKPTFKWEKKDGVIKDGYFRLDFKTNSFLGLKREVYNNLYSDLSQISSKNFLSSVIGSFKEKNDNINTIIPICKINVPVPNIPGLTILMQLQIEIYASGRTELSLSNNHSIGMQIRNNKLRVISDHDYDVDFIIKASSNLLLGVYAGLNMTNISLVDIGLSGGLKTELKSTIHTYDDSGKVNTVKSDLPTDLLSDLSTGNENIKVCGDLSGFFVLDAIFNSNKTLANKIGLNHKFNIFNENNASIIPGKIKHLENWQFVEKCTVNDRYYALNNKIDLNTEKIIIDKYSKIITINNSETINILELPEEYGIIDIIFESEDSNIASVSNNGTILAKTIGATIITVKTKDNKYSSKCHVLVKE